MNPLHDKATANQRKTNIWNDDCIKQSYKLKYMNVSWMSFLKMLQNYWRLSYHRIFNLTNKLKLLLIKKFIGNITSHHVTTDGYCRSLTNFLTSDQIFLTFSVKQNIVGKYFSWISAIHGYCMDIPVETMKRNRRKICA